MSENSISVAARKKSSFIETNFITLIANIMCLPTYFNDPISPPLHYKIDSHTQFFYFFFFNIIVIFYDYRFLFTIDLVSNKTSSNNINKIKKWVRWERDVKFVVSRSANCVFSVPSLSMYLANSSCCKVINTIGNLKIFNSFFLCIKVGTRERELHDN